MKLQQQKTAEQNSELTTKPTLLAQAMSGLQMGSDSSLSEQSQQSQQSQESKPEFKQEYKELDAFEQQTISQQENIDNGESDSAESEEMSDEDAEQAAAFFVGSGAGFVESLFDYPVTIDHETQQAIAAKAVPVIIKNAKGVNLPPWLIRYREELELLAVIAGAGLSIYSQIKQAKAAEKAERKKSDLKFNNVGDVVTNGS